MGIRNVFKYSIVIFSLGFLALLSVSLLKSFGVFEIHPNSREVHYHLHTSEKQSDTITDVRREAPGFRASEHTFFMGHSADDEEGGVDSRHAHASIVDTIIGFSDTSGVRSFENFPGYYGIDVSHWQHKIDWAKVVSEETTLPVRFVIIKATQGAKGVDKLFAYNWLSLAHTNRLVGAYHFYTYHEDPIAQADHFLETVSFGAGHIKPIVDVELDCSGCKNPGVSSNRLKSDLRAFSDRIKERIGHHPIIYTYNSFYQEHLKGDFDDHNFWIAKYSSKMPVNFASDSSNLAAPAAYLWQFTNSGRIPGIVGRVDMSFMPAYVANRVILTEVDKQQNK